MSAFLRTEEFDAWLSALKDKVGRARIAHRIRSEPVKEVVASGAKSKRGADK